jgi:membrane protease subunit (stomatin/prohibitin family)
MADLLGGAGGLTPQDGTDEKIIGAQSAIDELRQREEALYTQIGREAYGQDPDAWSQSEAMRQLQGDLAAAQETLAALVAEKEAAAAAKAAAEAEAARLAAGAEAEAARAAAQAEAEKFHCQKCGTQNPGGTRFCQECGAPLAPPAPVAKKFCGNCGTEIPPGVRFCGGCGAKQG